MLPDILPDILPGDRETWNRFYQSTTPLISKSVAQVLRRRHIPFSTDDLDDLVGEVWIELLRDDLRVLRAHDPRRGRSLRSWIWLLAARFTIDRLRRQGTMQRFREDLGWMDHPGDEAALPELAVERAERTALACRAISQLRQIDRQFLAHCLEGTAPSELARNLGISVSTVYSRKFKIHQKLQRWIGVHRQRTRLRATSWAMA